MAPAPDRFEDGTGEPLLLVHGFTATWRVWGDVAPRLAEDFHVLAPTLPGHSGGPELSGRPTVDALADWLQEQCDEHGWEQIHVAGFSLGGWLALELAKPARGRARTVTAIAPGGAEDAQGAREARRVGRLFRRGRRAARLAEPRLERLISRPRLRHLALRDMVVDGAKVPPAAAAGMIRDYAATPVFEELLDELNGSGGLHDLETVDVPVHLVWGERDRVLPVRNAAFFREAIPHARLTKIPGAGHVPFWDAPDAVVRAIRDGVAALSGGEGASTPSPR